MGLLTKKKRSPHPSFLPPTPLHPPAFNVRSPSMPKTPSRKKGKPAAASTKPTGDRGNHAALVRLGERIYAPRYMRTYSPSFLQLLFASSSNATTDD